MQLCTEGNSWVLKVKIQFLSEGNLWKFKEMVGWCGFWLIFFHQRLLLNLYDKMNGKNTSRTNAAKEMGVH